MDRTRIRLPLAIGALTLAFLAVWLGDLAFAQPKSTWDAIKERRTFRVGATQAEPWYFKDPRTNQWSGFAISVANEIAQTMGVKLEIVETTWGNAVPALQANQIDLMFVLDATPQRALAVDFIMTPLLYYALAVLHREKLKVETWEDLNKPEVNISVTVGTTIDRYITERLKKANILRFPTNDETVAAFQSGRSDVASLFHPALTMLQKKVGMGKITLPKPIRFSTSSVAVRREPNPVWRDYLTHAIAYYYNTGKLQEFYEQFLRERGIDPKSVPPIMKELMD